MTGSFPDLYSFERVTITKVKFGHYVINIDGQPIEPEEVHARLSLFTRNDNSDPLNNELVKVLLRHQQMLSNSNFNSWLTQLGLLHNPTGQPQDINSQYICVYLSDFLELSNYDIAILLGWVTGSGQNYDRMIKHRKKAFYDNLSQKYASILESIVSQTCCSPSEEVSLNVKSLIQRELRTDISIGIGVTQNLVEQYLQQVLQIDERVAAKIKKAQKKEKPETISDFIDGVLHQIKKSPM